MNHNKAFNVLGYFVLVTPLTDYRTITYYGERKRKFAGVTATGPKRNRLRLFHVANFGVMVHKNPKKAVKA